MWPRKGSETCKREAAAAPCTARGGTERTISACVCLCTPLWAGHSEAPQVCGSVARESVLIEGGSSQTPGVLTPEGVARDGAWGTWSRGEMQKRSQNTAETSEPLPRMAERPCGDHGQVGG